MPAPRRAPSLPVLIDRLADRFATELWMMADSVGSKHLTGRQVATLLGLRALRPGELSADLLGRLSTRHLYRHPHRGRPSRATTRRPSAPKPQSGWTPSDRGPSGDRTQDQRVKSPVLCQLS